MPSYGLVTIGEAEAYLKLSNLSTEERSLLQSLIEGVTETIERWDADEASRRIELHVGRDLQFIRINGTVVGSLAGLIIYSVAQFLF